MREREDVLEEFGLMEYDGSIWQIHNESVKSRGAYGANVCAMADRIRLTVVMQAIKVHLNSNGKMMLTRVATPANLRAIATEYTNLVYPRSRKGLEKALADLTKIKDALDNQQ